MSIHEPSAFHVRSLLALGILPMLVPLVAALVVSALAIVVFALTSLDEDRPRPVAAAVRPAPSPFIDALASDDEAEVLAAIDTAARLGHRVPSLVLYHPNPRVVAHARATISRATSAPS